MDSKPSVYAVQYFSVLLYTVFITFVYWILYQKPVLGIDDANIYFTYVQNFVEGNGLVYNASGERVEGFTSLLWLMIITPLFYTSHFEFYVLALNVILISILLYRSIRFINSISQQQFFFSAPAYFFLIVISIIPGYVDWTILTLMETGLWSYLLVSITILLCRDRVEDIPVARFSILLALLALTRPESTLWGVVFILLFSIRQFWEIRNTFSNFRKTAIPVAAFAGAFAGLVIFRMSYFGYPLPNTYYAKVSEDVLYNFREGLRYYVMSIFEFPLLAFVSSAALIASGIIIHRLYHSFRNHQPVYLRDFEKKQFVIIVVTFVSLAIPIYVGGDHFKLARFYQPFVPIYLFTLLNVPFWNSVIQTRLKINRAKGVLFISLFIPFIYCLSSTPLHTYYKESSPIIWEFKLAELGKEEGNKMNKLFSTLEELPSVGVSAAGGFSYGYNGTVTDLMGLNNTEMAHAQKEKHGPKNHAAFDKNTFYKQSPDIFHGYFRLSAFVDSPEDEAVYENTSGFKNSFACKVYKNIFSEKRFISEYLPVIISRPGSNLFLKTYCNRKFVAELLENNFKVKLLQRNAAYTDQISVN